MNGGGEVKTAGVLGIFTFISMENLIFIFVEKRNISGV
jgi:hypothetical protein